MEIQTNENGEITAYTLVGGVENGQDYAGTVPDDFADAFKPGWYKLVDGEIMVNPDYTEPTVEVPSGPTEQDRINAQLLKSTAQNAAANAAILKQLATIASAGTDTEEA